MQALSLRLKPGCSVNESVGAAFAEEGFACGYVRLRNAAVSPMRYVIPATSPDGAHAAWYSDTRNPDGVTMIEDAGIIFGRRDGEPFLHCHGIWREPDGSRRMGHLLPLDSAFAEPAAAQAFGVSGALFEVRHDRETNFSLFSPEPSSEIAGGSSRAVLCTIRPNEDICLSIENICRKHAIRDAAVHGIGSLVGADFENGPAVTSYATEVLIRKGGVRGGKARLDIVLVGMDGSLAEGMPTHGNNPVCVTFELLIEEVPQPAP